MQVHKFENLEYTRTLCPNEQKYKKNTGTLLNPIWTDSANPNFKLEGLYFVHTCIIVA